MTRTTLNRRLLPKNKRTSRAATSLTLESLEDRCLLSTSATFVKQDTTTQGNWIGTYGLQGYDVINNTSSLPSYATFTAAADSIRRVEEKRCLHFDPIDVNRAASVHPVPLLSPA